ncbi:hypothetical protein GCM10010339_82880 [Streptomyces alanosinicus]|uniref:Uncharacterized protein n=1 Tax=Streptomyces alanosinicus TaxID=68171 RepID=A0A918YSX2_9ACTN|nr:hypothetical protein GCM10010339_82880 [Streptomyces alanosinicus]
MKMHFRKRSLVMATASIALAAGAALVPASAFAAPMPHHATEVVAILHGSPGGSDPSDPGYSHGGDGPGQGGSWGLAGTNHDSVYNGYSHQGSGPGDGGGWGLGQGH